MEDEDKEDKNSLNIWCGNFTERVSLGAGTKTVQTWRSVEVFGIFPPTKEWYFI